MSDHNVIIKIYSDRKDISFVTSSINQLKIIDINISCLTPADFEVNANEIIILQVFNNTSMLLDKALDLKDRVQNEFIFVLRNEDALLVSTIAKLGFSNIFILPDELHKLTSYLKEIITNKKYLTDSPFPASSQNYYNFDSLLGESPQILKVKKIAKRISENDKVSVLILGETGTGKGLLAKAIHKNSKSGTSPFIEIVCSAIPEELLESELFGYEQGAFTNAVTKKLGLFEMAEKGTLFLDEVGDLTLNLQVKLLRVIERKVIRRLGGVEDISVETRIISSTNRDLNEMVEKEIFRKDLYHRLNVISLMLPPLRDRGNDIILLAEKFIKEFNIQFNKSVDTFEDGLTEFLLSYTWPGNIRELRNAIERAVLLSDDNLLRINDFSSLLKNLPLNVLENQEKIRFHPNLIRLDLDYEDTNLKKLSVVYAKEVLSRMKGNKTKSAKLLGISRPKLDKLLF